MNSAAINALRRKFIILATLSFFFVILFTGGMTALSNNWSLRMQAGHTLGLIIENGGTLPEPANTEERIGASDDFEGLTPEYVYGARYFSVIFDEDGDPTSVELSHMRSVEEERAVEYAREAVAAYEHSATISLLNLGMVDTYFYRVSTQRDGSTIVAFLDCSFQMLVNNEVGWNTVLICGIGLVGSFLLVLLFSGRAIRPEIENARKQKQFITNASHELKTPLAVIRANTEVIEMLQGESEWTKSTMAQVDRMDGLVQNLVMIARAEERENRSEMGEIDVSRVVSDSVDPFRALAQQEHLELVCEPGDHVTMVADASAIQQLCTLLVDNAIKYCDEGGAVRVEASSPRKGRVTLQVSNTFADGRTVQFARYFERFYRDDEAHSDEGGYGIGLSVAESICKRYRGSIRATWKAGDAVFTCQLRSA
ncbi:MAG: HAMP domain-containing histidine kinase [Atopobiaceae bacterium]|nr:HAMP domain-containing histidine kinase [Atopobiaceae bacterium]